MNRMLARVIAAGLAFALLSLASCGERRSTDGTARPTPAPEAASNPDGDGQLPNDNGASSEWLPGPTEDPGYVSAKACAECHAEEHATWFHSYHRSMTQRMTAETVVADFEDVHLEMHGERFSLGRQGDRFWVDVVDLEQPPENRAAARFPMEMVTGSHHMQVFWLPAGAGNAQLGFPFTWLIGEARWVPRDSTFIRDPEAPQQIETWNMTCIRCHATAGQPRPRREEQVFDTRVADLGIACEACHGPGADHVRFQRAAVAAVFSAGDEASPIPDGVLDRIVQPRKLDPVRSSHVCAQCHSMKWFDETEGWAESGFRYRPGEDLEATTPIIRPSRLHEQPRVASVVEQTPGLLKDFFWPDGMIRVAGREFNGLVESACFQRGQMSCLSCHSMHDYADRNDQLKAGMDGDRSCLQCHDAANYGTTHTRHPAGSSGSACVECHMPHTSYALFKGIRQHQIDSPRVGTALASGRPNACNLCHLDRSLAWTADRLTEWYGQPKVEVPAEEAATSAIVRQLLSGDAGQRALAAWHLGWAPARELTGDDWQAPLLARLLTDPYAAVRSIAHRSLRTLPGYAELAFDYVGPSAGQVAAQREILQRWQRTSRARDADQARALLLSEDGTSDQAAIEELQRRRDDRPMRLRE